MFFMVWWTLLLCEVFMLVNGFIAVILGRFPYRPGRPVTGIPAYIGGALMLAPMAIGLPLASIVARDQESISDAIGKPIVIRAGFIVVCFAAAYIQAALLFDPVGGAAKGKWLKEVQSRKRRKRKKDIEEDEDAPRRRRRKRDREDLDDDAPRRRRRRDEDAEELDVPTRRRSRDDDEDFDDDPPRRRPADDDDEDMRHAHRPGPPPLPRG